MEQVVIVGAGQAGFQAAWSLRELGFGGAIALLGSEPEAPYQRPPLSKAYLAGAADRGKVSLRPPSFYAEHRIDLRLATPVAGIDRTAGRVSLADGSTIPYDHLVLATGSRSRPLPVPGADLAGIHQLRSLADADALRRELARARHVVIVGAGFIGLEVAATAAKLRGEGSGEGPGQVSVVEATGRTMSRTVSVPTAAFFTGAHEARGVAFRFGATAAAIHGHEGRVVAVEFADGSVIPADLVLVGIGVVPNTELAAECGLDIRNGIAADEHLLTSDPAISAIGDCVSAPSIFAGGAPVLVESVQNAIDGAKTVAARLVGRPAAYRTLPWFWSDQGGDKLQIAGLAMPHDETLVLGEAGSADAFSVLCFRAGTLAGVETVNRGGDHLAARRILASGARPSLADASRPDFDLRAFAKTL